MPFAHTDDLTIYYEMSEPDNPDALRLLYIGGTGSDLRVKPNIMDSPLARQFNLLAYDQRGLGQTDIPGGPYTMTQYGDDAATIMDHVGWKNAHIYGVSFGGMVAQHLVLRHPVRANKLVLACTSCGGEGMASYPLHEIDHLQGRNRFEFMMSISDSRRGPEWQKQNPELVDKQWDFTVNQRRNIPVTEESIRGAYLQIEARRNHDTSEHLKNISAETFVCGGRYDLLAPPTNLEILNKKIPNSKLKFYEGGHLFLMQDPSATRDIGEFLQASD
jgi:3-oxoadipate enol-lactonase